MNIHAKHIKINFYWLVVLVILLSCFVSSVHAQITGSTPSLPTTVTAQDRMLLEKDLSGVVRGFIWGLPPTAVLESEQGQFMDQVDNHLMYLARFKLGETIDFRSTIAYEFQQNQLWRVHVINEQHYPRPQDRIELLGEIQKELEKKFGKPTSEDFKWFDEKDKNWPQNWGWAVYRGDLFITIKWETSDTLVTLELGAKEELLPRIDLVYESRLVKEAQTRTKTQQLLQAPSGL